MRNCSSLAALALLVTGLSSAQGIDYVTGTTLYPYSTQSKPAKGESYIDTTYHTPVTRVTNSASDSGAWGTITGYSTWSPLSSDGRYLLLYGLVNLSSGSGYLLYDATTFRFIGKMPFLWWNGNDPEPRWDCSGSHPTWIYYRRDRQLRYYDVATTTDGLVHDFTADFPSFGSSYYIYNGEEGIPSSDSRYWAFMLRGASSPYAVTRVFVYDKTADKVISSKDVTGNDPNSVSMSPSGDYVYVAYEWSGTNNEYDGPHAYRRDFSANVKIASSIPHLSFGWTTQGHEVAVSLNPGTDYLQMVRLDTGTVYRLLYHGDMGWDLNALHAYQSKPGWAFISSYVGNNTKWSYNQIFAVELDETKTYGGSKTPRVWRVSFTQNIIGANYYYEQPNAQLDIDGSRIWFGANWRSDGAAPDVYQVTLPSTWWEDLSGQVPVAPVISTAGAVNAASGIGGSVAPGEFLTIYGVGVGPVRPMTSSSLDKVIGSTKAYFNGVEAFLTYVSSTQINALVPHGVAGSATAELQVEYRSIRSNKVILPVAAAAPGIFTVDSSGTGRAVAVNENGSFNTVDNPAQRGSIVAFWATGAGQTDPSGVDGAQPSAPVFPRPLLPVSVAIGGVVVPPEDVKFVGLIYAGITQINVKVPTEIPSGGMVDLLLTIGSASSRKGVTIAIR